MFTGIVEEIGKVKSIGTGKIVVRAGKVIKGTIPGDSIAVNGICLTVIDINDNSLSFETMPETLRRTNLGSLRSRDEVNLERALAAGGRMGGHFVQGHVDATGQILSIKPEGNATIVRLSAPKELMRYIVEKGFIAVDGTSLTVIARGTDTFSISLVGYTKQNTILGRKKVSDTVNLEVDILAKYVENLTKGEESGITLGMLTEHGFLV